MAGIRLVKNDNMAIHISKSKNFDEETGNLKENSVHYVPCKINFDGSANVSKYFRNLIHKNGGKNGLQASFRGYPLHGCVVDLPSGYKGLVVKETSKPLNGSDRTFHVAHIFESLTYWNWDKVPTKDDAFLSALDWIDLAEAVHSPIEEIKEDKSACNSPVNINDDREETVKD